jgi:hypothetical protein
MDTKVKSGNPHGEFPEPEPRIHNGRTMPMPQFASIVKRNGKIVRINGVPVKEDD